MPLITFKPELQILAIDLGATCGFFHSSGKHGIWIIGTGPDRFTLLRNFIFDTARAYGCKLIAVEMASFGSKWAKTKTQHDELLGVVRGAASELGVEVRTFAPTSIKKTFTGYGRADKPQMVAACKRLLDIEPQTHDVADAAAVLLMADLGYGTNTATKKPRKRRAKPLAAGARAPKRKPGYLF